LTFHQIMYIMKIICILYKRKDVGYEKRIGKFRKYIKIL